MPVDPFQNGDRLEDSHTFWNARWEERMEQTSREIRHKKTSAFLLTFAQDDLGVSKEVDELAEVFDNHYGFKVYNKSITATGIKAQQQAHRDLAEFVYQEDGPQGLLIIYFAGHGYSDVRTKPGDMYLCGSMPAPTDEESKAAREERLQTNRIIWSEIETAIGTTAADVLLIFDCCNAGRLGRPLRAPGPSYYEVLGACSEDSTTMGPGQQSFTRALTCVLREFAARNDIFSTSELKAAIMEHVDFPKNQIPMLAHRRMPGEHIVIASKQLESRDSSPTLSKGERANELDNQEFIDLRFWFRHKVQLEHLDSTADALNKLMKKNVGWERIAFIQKSSPVQLALMRWMNITWPGGKRHQSASAPLPVVLNGKLHTPELANTLKLQIPSGAFASSVSEAPSASSSVALCIEQPGLAGNSGASEVTAREDSIFYHLGAIVLRLRSLTWSGCTRLANMILFSRRNGEVGAE